MENLAPPVVAVIVACDPGAWFEESLQSFAEQDYPELSVLVLDAGSLEDPTARVAAVLPGAYVRRLEENLGFGPSVDEVLGMVQGASHLLICHDDVALDPGVVHILVEESFRSNAGVVAPKLVAWDDPQRLLHVGMAVDKGGAVVDRVEPGEIDHGQHDAVQDVFLAPGGCTLVRADLFAELGGFDPGIAVMGEDLDLCWRAQVAGARVVVAPAARVRHLERLAGGRRPVPATEAATLPATVSGGSPPTTPAGARPPGSPGRRARRTPKPTLQALQRRHELRVVLSSYGRFHLVRVLPQLLVLATAETVLSLLAGNRERAAAVVHAWRWNWSQRRQLRARRAFVASHRRLGDSEVRRLQLHGSARLTAYVRRAVSHGLQVAHIGGEAELLGLDLAEEEAERRRRGFSVTGRVVTGTLVALVLLVGSRQLLGSGFPYVGWLLPFPSAGEFLHRFVTAWQPTGVGTTDPTSPATVILGVLGFVLGGSTGFLQKVLVFGCIPVGAIGMARLVRPFGSSWARVVSTVAYLAVPVAYDALALGRWDTLLVYAAGPWIFARLARASAISPYAPPVPESRRRAWRAGLPGQALALGALVAAVCSLAPAAGAVTLLVALALAVGIVLTGRDGRAAGRVLAVGLGGVAVAVVLLAPWSIAVLHGPDRWAALTGVPLEPARAPGWPALLRLAVGPIGDTPLAFGMLGAATLPLFIGARRRLVWASHAWVVVLAALAVGWAEGRGWLAGLAIPTQLLLGPAAVGAALAVGLGVAAFERDLSAYRFGWRQAAAVLAAGAAAMGALPVVAAAGSGRWDLPHTGFGEATTWMASRSPAGGFRVLWLGDPRVLPGAGWTLGDGTAYAVSEQGLPDATALWPGGRAGPASALAHAVHQAEDRDTVELGALLAPYAVRYLVVVDTLAPAIPGYQSPEAHPGPARLLAALSAQSDLRQVLGQGGLHVFADDAALPEFATHVTPVTTTAPTAGAGGAPAGAGAVPEAPPTLGGWVGVHTPAPSATVLQAEVPGGALVLGRAPSSSWKLVSGDGPTLTSSPAFGYGARFDLPIPGGHVVVRQQGSWAHEVEIAAEVLAWLVVAGALLGRRRWLDWWYPRVHRRRTGRHRIAAAAAER
jgi:GT2 family glycosyltransferase